MATFHHEALTYDGTDEFVPTALGVVREGLENDEPTLVLAPSARLQDLTDALGRDADDVTFVASDRHARNPARVASILDTFRLGAGERHSRSVKDTGPDRNRTVTLEARFADCLLNLAALSAWALSLVCLFDSTALDDDARHGIRQGHRRLRGSDTNADYLPDLGTQLYADPLEDAPPSADRTVITDGGLPRARSFLRTRAAGSGLGADTVDDLVLAANEIVTNSLRYGGGVARLAVWTEDDAVVCEVRDAGFLPDPLAGRFAPPASATSGRGIWLANNLCDLVQVRSSRAGGTVVRMYVER